MFLAEFPNRGNKVKTVCVAGGPGAIGNTRPLHTVLREMRRYGELLLAYAFQ